MSFKLFWKIPLALLLWVYILMIYIPYYYIVRGATVIYDRMRSFEVWSHNFLGKSIAFIDEK